VTTPDQPAEEAGEPDRADPPGDNGQVDHAVPPRRRLLWVTLAVAAVVIVIDQVTKAIALANLQPRLASGEGPIELLGPVLKLTFVQNTGAGFGIGANFTWVFALIAAIVAVVIVRTARKLGSVAWAIALGGLMGGALGNLVDRLMRPPGFGEAYAGPGQGYVVDFIQLPYWPVFNVADMAIVGSAILMVVLTVRGIPLAGNAGKTAGGSASVVDA